MFQRICFKIRKFPIVSNIRKIHYIGQDYYHNKFNPLIHTEIFRNPKWYSAYTPYQSEISQGRLELTYLYQEFIKNITNLDISNSGLLDHSHSLFEAIRLSINNRTLNDQKHYVLVDSNLFENLNNVLKTYSELIFSKKNVEIIYTDFTNSDEFLNEHIKKNNINLQNILGIVIYSSDKYGFINKNYNWGKKIQNEINILNTNLYNKQKNYCLITISGDLMHHLHLKSHKELGANIGIGNIQRMGVPLFGGGPHSGYFAIDKNLLRLLPGKFIDTSIDKYNDNYYRLALQTREQHIKKHKATSNICTNQALINNYMAAWCIYHGKEGLFKQSNKIFNDYRNILSNELSIDNNTFFDSITIEPGSRKYNELYNHNNLQTGTFHNMHSFQDIEKLIKIIKENKICENNNFINRNIYRDNNDKFLDQEIFNKYTDNPLEFLRYIKSLEKKDFCLSDGMMPLGSCTMKYNPHESLEVFNNPDLLTIHPYEKSTRKTNLLLNIEDLKNYLINLTGLSRISLQPLAGSHAELSALLIMKKYFNFERNIVLIPNSAHGTNPASVNVAGCIAVFIKHTQNGHFDLIDVEEKINKYGNKIMGIMITHPSTFGFFDNKVKDVIRLVKSVGGLIYLDGANMNSWVGHQVPKELGFNMMHINLHKTFTIPHGGGGPGVGVLGVCNKLKDYVPNDFKKYDNSIGRVSSSTNGNTLANLISLDYIKRNINNFKSISSKAIENANYLKNKLKDHFEIPYVDENNNVAHELILDFSNLLNNTGLTENDVSKRLIDYGIHPPTMSWPVHRCLMMEPTETESLENLDYLCESFINIKNEIDEIKNNKYDINNNVLKNSPHSIKDLFNWDYPYDKNKAFFPLGTKNTRKFWNNCNRIDDIYGDKKLIKNM